MKIYFLITSVMFFCGNLKAQEISRNKAIAINNIEKAGYTVKTASQDEDIFGYVRYDKFGEARVYYQCTGSIVRKVTFLCDDPTQPPKRNMEIFKYLSTEDMDKARQEFGKAEPYEIYAYKTSYYNGKAKYSYFNDYDNKKWYFTITLLD